MKLLALLLILVSQVHAEENQAGCKVKLEVVRLENLEDLEKHLEWHGADNVQMQKAACKNLQVPSAEEIKLFLAQYSSKNKNQISSTVNGVSFQNESPAMIDLFKNLSTAKDSFGIYEDRSNQKNFQKEFSINPECKKVECAVTKIWGEKSGLKMLYALAKHNFNTSEYAFTNSDRLTEDELDDVLMAMEDLPKHLIPVGTTNQRYTHFSRGYKLKDQSDRVAANAVVMLFDTWSNEPRFERQYSAFHEISHNIGSRLGRLDESPSWLKLSGWVKKGDDWSKGEKACFVTEYSLGNPFEDFAESLSTYRYNPKEFKSKCPEKYNFVKEKVFKNIEYLSNQTCAEIPSVKLQAVADQVMPEMEKDLAKLTIDKNLLSENCKVVFKTYPVTENSTEECQAAIVKSQLDKLDSESFKQTLAKNGINVEQSKLPILQSALAETILSKGLSAELSDKLRSSIASNAKEMFDDLIDSALPKKTETSTGLESVRYLDSQLSMNCRKFYWSGDKAVKKCLSDYIIADDKTWSKFGTKTLSSDLKFPEGLTEESKTALKEKYYTKLENILIEGDLLNAKVASAKGELKKQANEYFKRTSYNFYQEKDWKNLGPSDFCRKLYNTPDDYYKKYVFVPGSNEIPGFQSWCEQKQSEKKKRFQFNDTELNEWVEKAL